MKFRPSKTPAGAVWKACVESDEGYFIARYSVVGGNKFVATKDGKALRYLELWNDDASKAREYEACVLACEMHKGEK